MAATRRGYTKFTRQDFQEYPVWELQHSLTTAEPYQGRIPFEADSQRAFFVRTAFTLADKTKLIGWTMICVPPYDINSLNPTLLTDQGPVDLTKVARQPKQKDVDEAFRRVGKPAAKVFPLKFETDVPVPGGPVNGEMNGFLHQLRYYDDNGWEQRVEFYYQTASDLATALKTFHDTEAARKAALEPSKEEKALLKGAKAGDLAKIASLLSRGVNCNRGGTFEYGGYTRKNVTPLMLAAEAGHVEVVRALLKAGAKVDLADDSNEPRKSGRTALAYACLRKRAAVARLLLDAGANPNHRLSYKHTVFDELCEEGPLQMIRLFLDSGADPNSSCGKSDYFALGRVVGSERLDVMELLLEYKADINGFDADDHETALVKASKLLRLEVVRFLLEHGADVGARTLGQWTALHRAVASASWLNPAYDRGANKQFAKAMQVVKSLVEHGADVNAVTRDGDRPLTLARDCKFPELARYLISQGGRQPCT
jgi:ankyrin repeat protein